MGVHILDIDGSAGDATEYTFPGLLGAITITRLTLSAQTPPSGDALTARVQDETGGSPANHIEATIADGDGVGTGVTGSVPIAAAGTMYLRVVTANGAGFLRCQIEYIDGLASTVGALCTVAAVKTYLGIAGATHDALIEDLIEGVTGRMEGYMRRHVASDSYDQYFSSNGLHRTVVLPERPVIGTPTVTIDGAAFTSFLIDADAGVLHFDGGAWPSGVRTIRVQYTAGYNTIPSDLREACVKQSAFESKLTVAKGDKLGFTSEGDPTGTSIAMLTDDWVPGVKHALDRYRSFV